MSHTKDRRITPKERSHHQSAQSHGSDMVNGSAVGHTLPFVAEKQVGYLNLMAANPYALNPENGDGYGGVPGPSDTVPTTPAAPAVDTPGRPGYVAPVPDPTPPPAPTPPPGGFQGGGLTPPSLQDPSDTGGGTTLPVSSPPVISSPAPDSLNSPDTSSPANPPTTSGPPAVITTPATASPEPPVANAGPSQTITGTTATLDGSGSSDPQDSQLSFSWTLVSGPNMPAINNPAGATTAISSLVSGSYIFKLTVTNALGLNSTSTTSITVTGADNSGATVNTGVTTLNSGSTVLTTAPLGDSGLSPYGGLGAGGGGGGGGSTPDTAATPESMWQKIWDFTKDHWLLLGLLAAGTAYVVFKKDGKNDL